ncbi:MAG: LysR family transcriptional regulator [Actinomycetota bacterium]|nr:LysR family transcriptional regulator [Actinomycetota bacterium]
MDWRQVEYFVAIVDHGGFTKAADALHVAQPSLSQSVRRLEADLGASLFVRHGRGVRLTAAGHSLLGPARRLLRDANTARESVSVHTGAVTGVLDLVALPTLVADPLVGHIGAFRSLHPRVMVRVAEPGTARVLTEMIRDGRCEVGLTESIEPIEGLTQVPLSRQRMLAVLPPGPEADLPERLDLREFGKQALIMTPRGTSTRDLLDHAYAAVGVSPFVAVETGQREAIVPLVLAGAGATLLPEPLARDAGLRGARVRPLKPSLHRDVGLIHIADGLSPVGAAFVALVAAHGRRRPGRRVVR